MDRSRRSTGSSGNSDRTPNADWQLQGTGDLDGDGTPDLVWWNQSSGQVYLWKMNGAAVAAALPIATVADLSWRLVAVRDFDGDGRADLLWRNRTTGQVYVWFMNGS